MSEQKQPAEVGPVELVLGPLPEPDVPLVRGGCYTEALVHKIVAKKVAAERERWATACWERRGHFASDAAARAFAELVRDGRA